MLRAIIYAVTIPVCILSANPLKYWPQWRGPLATGEAPNGSPPTEWSKTKNIAWKTPLPGTGHSTPVVWEDHIFLTATQPHGEKLGPQCRPH